MDPSRTSLINTDSVVRYDDRSKDDTLQKVIEKYTHSNRIQTRQ